MCYVHTAHVELAAVVCIVEACVVPPHLLLAARTSLISVPTVGARACDLASTVIPARVAWPTRYGSRYGTPGEGYSPDYHPPHPCSALGFPRPRPREGDNQGRRRGRMGEKLAGGAELYCLTVWSWSLE